MMAAMMTSRPCRGGGLASSSGRRLASTLPTRTSRCSVVATAALTPTKVKVCGIKSAADARLAVEAGASFIGIIIWPGSKRCVSDMEEVREIAAVARAGGADPVGVFVDEGADEIIRACDEGGLEIAQLHGDGARRALGDLPHRISAIWVLNVDGEGNVCTPLPKEMGTMSDTAETAKPVSNSLLKSFDWQAGMRRTIDYVLLDGLNPGSGESYDWRKLRVPRGFYRKGWALAGGLHPGNVADAIRIVHPDIVDVASGVAGEDGVAKDAGKIEAFFEAVKSAVSV